MSNFENTPTSVVYDVFAETAGLLTARYTSLSDAATSEPERERWWAKVMELRDTKRAVPAHDREQLIVHITRWAADLKALESADRD
ncbi:hypothetical protein [Wenjunlia tyrosinilytica]|uniref:Uncharacterized protein n=1 Tax=Wenjunlia tyrosinilytica TaxID=1544741 RepID=A0A917ZVX9_9ACTN|nr:hypothetical protein [Wenjunlia tyrosinilytica]GGO98279.1 hypothetical protein GCM10012280_62030 [Wenjunlia tyrosinilytica]